MSAATALLEKAKADFDTKPHRYKLIFLRIVLTNGGSIIAFNLLDVLVGYDQPITPANEEEWLAQARLILRDESVYSLGFSKYE